MTVVVLRRRHPETAAVETLARFFVPDAGAPAVMEPTDPADRAGIEAILGEGVPDARGELLQPADGEAYVLALLEAYRGSRLWAERVS